MLNWDLLTLTFLISKGYKKKNEKGITDWEKIYCAYLTKYLHTEYMEASYNSRIEIKQPNNKGAKDMNKHFTKEGVRMKRCSTLVIIREISIRYHFISRMAKLKKTNNV